MREISLSERSSGGVGILRDAQDDIHVGDCWRVKCFCGSSYPRDKNFEFPIFSASGDDVFTVSRVVAGLSER